MILNENTNIILVFKNKKERRKALRSAISSTVIRELVEKRGHNLPKNYPFIIDGVVESISRTKDAKGLLDRLGMKDELERVSKKKVRPGKGKLRGRKYKQKTGPLIVVSQPCNLQKAARNIPGIDVRAVSRLNTEILAPGTDYGRLTLWTSSAIEKMSKDNLFM